MFVMQPLITAVGIDAGTFRQFCSTSSYRNIGSASGGRIGTADDAAPGRDDDFGFDPMSLLLARVPAALFATGALDRLFGAVNDQGFSFFGADLDLARHAQNFDRQPFNPPQAATDRCLIDLIQTGQ